MRFIHRLSLFALLALAPAAIAQYDDAPRAAPLPVANAICPIGKEPIDHKTFVEWKGVRVGFCCKDCVATFKAWGDARKDAFIAKADVSPAQPAAAAAMSAQQVQDMLKPYPLTTCIVSGEDLGSMGDPVRIDVDGREILFCCNSCLPRFEADKATYLKKLDDEIIRTQREVYPLKECPISGKPLGSMGDADDFVLGNRLIRLCCASCRDAVRKDPAPVLARLDKAAADAQRAAYPLDTCPITKKKLGSMGEPAEMTLAGRLVRLCCPPCEPKVRARAWETLQALDKARAK